MQSARGCFQLGLEAQLEVKGILTVVLFLPRLIVDSYLLWQLGLETRLVVLRFAERW